MTDRFWNVAPAGAESERATLNLYGSIGGSWLDDFDERTIAAELEAVGDRDLDVQVNSRGGSVFAAMAIKGLLERHARSHSVDISVTGLAASAATIITCAEGCKVTMSPGAMMLVHPVRLAPSSAMTPDELKEAAEHLEKVRLGVRDIYHARTGLSEKELDDLMGKESYLTADEAVEKRFADSAASGSATASASSDDVVMQAGAEEVPAVSASLERAASLFARTAENEEKDMSQDVSTSEPENASETAPTASVEADVASASVAAVEESTETAEAVETAEAAETAPEVTARVDDIQAAVAAERERIIALDALCSGLSSDQLSASLSEAKRNGTTPAAFMAANWEHLKNLALLGLRRADAACLDGLTAEGNTGVEMKAKAAEGEDADAAKARIADELKAAGYIR